MESGTSSCSALTQSSFCTNLHRIGKCFWSFVLTNSCVASGDKNAQLNMDVDEEKRMTSRTVFSLFLRGTEYIHTLLYLSSDFSEHLTIR